MMFQSSASASASASAPVFIDEIQRLHHSLAQLMWEIQQDLLNPHILFQSSPASASASASSASAACAPIFMDEIQRLRLSLAHSMWELQLDFADAHLNSVLLALLIERFFNSINCCKYRLNQIKIRQTDQVSQITSFEQSIVLIIERMLNTFTVYWHLIVPPAAVVELEKCMICHEKNGPFEVACSSNYKGHWIHPECLTELRKMSTQCPSCRKPLRGSASDRRNVIRPQNEWIKYLMTNRNSYVPVSRSDTARDQLAEYLCLLQEGLNLDMLKISAESKKAEAIILKIGEKHNCWDIFLNKIHDLNFGRGVDTMPLWLIKPNSDYNGVSNLLSPVMNFFQPSLRPVQMPLPFLTEMIPSGYRRSCKITEFFIANGLFSEINSSQRLLTRTLSSITPVHSEIELRQTLDGPLGVYNIKHCPHFILEELPVVSCCWGSQPPGLADPPPVLYQCCLCNASNLYLDEENNLQYFQS